MADKRIYIISCLLVLFNVNMAFAGIEKLIKNVFPAGTMSNHTRSAIVNEQEAGHLVGGSVIIKTPAEPGMQLIHAQAPSCKMGGLPCGAQFELLGGSLSVIKSEELIRHLKGLIDNTGTYIGMLALQTLCPQCEDIMSWIDSKADWLNNMAKTDCEDMARLADGAYNKIMAGSRATRQSAAVLNGDGSDMADFIRKSKADNGGDPTGGHPELQSLLGDNFNLVWKALEKKAPNSARDAKSLKELLMSISGTIIGTKEEGSGRHSVKHKKSLVSKELIEQFIGINSGSGSAISLYSCNEDKLCLDPAIKSVNIPQSDTLIGRVGTLLSSITKKLQTNIGPLTAEEETLVALSSVSLLTKIELDLSNYANPDAAVQNEFVEALCYDVITNYLAQLLREVSVAVGELEYVQLADSGVFGKFDQEVRETLRMLSRAKHDAFKRYDLIAATKARMHQEISFFNMKFEELCNGGNQQ